MVRAREDVRNTVAVAKHLGRRIEARSLNGGGGRSGRTDQREGAGSSQRDETWTHFATLQIRRARVGIPDALSLQRQKAASSRAIPTASS